LLHVDICCEVLASQVLFKWSKEMEFTEHEIETAERVVHNFQVINSKSLYKPSFLVGEGSGK
jgi:hypothetical protein